MEKQLENFYLDSNSSETSSDIQVNGAPGLALWDWNLVTNKLKWNDVHYLLMGLDAYSCEPSIELFMEKLHPDDRNSIRDRIQSTVIHHEAFQHQYRVIWHDGSIHWIVGTGRTIYDHEGAPIRMYGTAIELFEPRKTEQETRELMDRLKFLQEGVRAHEDFLRILTREFKHSLVEIQSSIEAAVEEIPNLVSNSQAGESVELSLASSLKRMAAMNRFSHKIVDLHFLHVGLYSKTRETLVLNDLLSEIIEDCKKLTMAPIEVLTTASVLGRWDRAGLIQVFKQLIENAIKFGGEKQIDIAVSQVDFDAIVRITDHGSGIEEKEKKQLQDILEDRLPSYLHELPGLGVYVANKIVKAHGGKLSFQTSRNLGSSFELRLPLRVNREGFWRPEELKP